MSSSFMSFLSLKKQQKKKAGSGSNIAAAISNTGGEFLEIWVHTVGIEEGIDTSNVVSK